MERLRTNNNGGGEGKLKHHTSQLHENRETTSSHFSPFSSAATEIAAAAAISAVIAVVSVSMSSSFDVYSSNGFDDDDHRHHPFDDASFVGYDTSNGFSSDGAEEFRNGNGNGKGKGFGDVRFGSDDGAGLCELDEVAGVEDGFAAREWRRLNAIRLEEKEMLEKELRNQILEEAEEFKHAFYEKRMLDIETSKTNNRDKDKVYVACQEKFHKEADKHYWKAI
ncbi:Clathrin light chain 1-like protein [Drosera capensis]